MKRWLLLCLLMLVGCSTPAEPAPVAVQVPDEAATSEEPTSPIQLDVSLIYPTEEMEVEKGQLVRLTAQIRNTQGDSLSDAQVTFTVRDPAGETIATIPGVAGQKGIYRSDYWAIPGELSAGTWGIAIDARVGAAQANTAGHFQVKNSTSDDLLSKYGFWLEAPILGGIAPSRVAEQGDAQNGMIRWGGVRAAMHLLPANWVEVHWREGDYRLENEEAVRRFLLEELGDIGFTPVRTLGPFSPIRFKEWDAWWGEARGTVKQDDLEWMLFYAPEVNKTFAIGTTVALPPNGVNAHEVLRGTFAVRPEIEAVGVAPEPLPELMASPELLSPPIATRYEGLGQPIILQWKPVKELAEDEYYEVVVDYDYNEDSHTVKFTTRETQLTLPESLYHEPNCRFFNWRVTLMRQTGVGEDGQPKGERISYGSLYWYVEWFYPPGERPFAPICPNHQV
ncbi:MAG: hypothetical protein M3220_09015 [Chloroflexota bacterium]|nr:hypothetical protein [Chloroflexota bacterium]